MKRIEKAIICALALGSILGCKRTSPDSVQRIGSAPLDEPTVVNLLRSALNSKPAKLYYRGTCDTENSDVISFPSIVVHSVSPQSSSLAMVQQVFQGDEGRISEIEEPDGIILVRTTGVSGKLLRTRISRLKLSQDEQYDPSAAIQTIENSADMRLAMHQSNWRLAATLGGLESMPSSGRPHLAPIRDNITVDEALDNLLQTFGGIAVYAECVRPNGEQLFRISLYGE